MFTFRSALCRSGYINRRSSNRKELVNYSRIRMSLWSSVPGVIIEIYNFISVLTFFKFNTDIYLAVVMHEFRNNDFVAMKVIVHLLSFLCI